MNKLPGSFNSGRATFFILVFVCIIVGGAILKIASTVILPFVIAAFLAFVTYPLIIVFDKLHFPRFVSILLIVLIIVIGIFLFGVVLFTSGKMIIDLYPQYEDRIYLLYDWVADLFNLPNDQAVSLWQNLWDQEAIRNIVRDATLMISNFSLRFASSATLIILFVVFLLVEASFFKEKLIVAFENRTEKISRIGLDIMAQVTRYLTAKFLISLANGIIFAVGFSLVGLEFAIVWGVVQFLLNFIPTLGSIIAGVVISLFALIQFWPEPGPFIIVLVIILGVNLLCNIFDPKIVGDHVGISPLIILVSLSIWGYIWGFAGMVLAVPMTVIIKIVCENIPIMEPVSILVGSSKFVRKKKAEKEKAETHQ
ncbi:MAG: AI-2E family transporter [Treponema sp.]|nr:AI-2E family transporter [Treponema sp.]MCL2237592.1 AI-2E family transporter [Treponema sp.]